jgi:hypothetical protein
VFRRDGGVRRRNSKRRFISSSPRRPTNLLEKRWKQIENFKEDQGDEEILP